MTTSSKPLGRNLLLTARIRNGLLNLGEGGLAWSIVNGLDALKRLLQTKNVEPVLSVIM